MKITFYGHASLGIEVGGKNIIIDPFITGNPQASEMALMAVILADLL
jgi:L-ascorbate metabolism protein UlaG (beta-lactamase superfamily)